MRLKWHLVRLLGVLESLPGEFMPRQVILFSMALRGGTVSVGGKVVKFGGSPMWILHYVAPVYERVSIRPDLLCASFASS
jgi:hypothetical protein